MDQYIEAFSRVIPGVETASAEIVLNTMLTRERPVVRVVRAEAQRVRAERVPLSGVVEHHVEPLGRLGEEEAARDRGVPVWGEVELAWRLRDPERPAPWLAVTGTNGKTTTVQMLQSILTAAGLRAVAVGNVGLPIVEAVMDPEPYDVMAVELSSFQLHYTHSMACESAAVLNVGTAHLGEFGGRPQIARANQLGRELTGIDVDHTGSAGLAGMLSEAGAHIIWRCHIGRISRRWRVMDGRCRAASRTGLRS